MQIKLLNEDPYSEIICKYFAQTFPTIITPSSKQLLDILTTIIVGDKNTRLGPIPSPEELVEIRKVISICIEKDSPIPILVAWGGVKTQRDALVDVAELSALNQLLKLDDCVRKYHTSGILVNIRIEDLGADWIYRDEEDISDKIIQYSSSFYDLVYMINGNHNIRPIKESHLMDKGEYFDKSQSISNRLNYLINKKLAGGDIIAQLTDLGWKGDLPIEQVNHYISRYEILYPNKSKFDYIIMAADYLGGAKVRYDLNGRANPGSKFIGISFISPIPGAPSSMFNTTLYYRTVPMNQGRTHIAPWRAKGYLEINSDNSVKVKVTSWNNKEILDTLHPVKLELKDNINKKVLIDADYLIRENESSLIPNL